MDSASRGFRHQGAHPGFQNVQKSIESKEGVSHAAAGRILGYAKAHASPAAKKRNPRLKRTSAHSKKLAKQLKF